MNARRLRFARLARTARVGLIVTLVGATLIGGCSSPETSSAPGESDGGEADEPVTITFAWWGSQARNDLTQEVITQFEAENPGIIVQGESSAFGDYFQKLTTQLAGGDGPDVFQNGAGSVLQYGTQGIEVDLRDTTVDVSTVKENVRQSYEGPDGEVWAIPWALNVDALYFNRATLSTLGSESEPDVSSWAAFEAWAEDVPPSADVDFALGAFAREPNPLQAWLREQGTNGLVDDGQLVVTKDQLVDWWTLMLEWQDKNIVAPPSFSQGYNAFATPQEAPSLLPGVAAGDYTVSNAIGALDDLTDGQAELVNLPGGAEHQFPVVTMALSVNSRSPQQEAALKFVEFLLNDEAAAATLGLERGVPASSVAVAAIEPGLTGSDVQQLDFVTETLSYVDDGLYLLTPAAVGIAYAAVADKVMSGEASPAEGAAEFVAAAQQALDSAP